MKRLILLVFMALMHSAVAGYDHSFEASIDGWVISADTAGLGGPGENRVATRVFLSHPKLKFEAQMELDGVALYVVWDHLDKLPRIKKPKASENFVKLQSDKDEYLESSRAIALVSLWLDTNKSKWKSDHAELLAALQGGSFPDSATKYVKEAQQASKASQKK
ncbi:MAG: hypothetical protein V4727_05715 [Verrucomicrobiota bacterium]